MSFSNKFLFNSACKISEFVYIVHISCRIEKVFSISIPHISKNFRNLKKNGLSETL